MNLLNSEILLIHLEKMLGEADRDYGRECDMKLSLQTKLLICA